MLSRLSLSLSVAMLVTAAHLLAQGSVSGTWLLTTDVFGSPLHQRLTLEQKGD